MAEQDITNPDYLLVESDPTKSRTGVQVLSGAGVEKPGYRLIDDRSEGVKDVQVVKVVSPLTGQGPADPKATGRYANMNDQVVQVNRVRVSRSVPPNQGSVVVRPPKTAIRRMNTSGQGTVGYY